MSTVEEILTAARALSASERARLLAALWDTTPPDDWVRPADEWTAEANRRSTAIDSGELSSSPWSEVRQQARRKANLDG